MLVDAVLAVVAVTMAARRWNQRSETIKQLHRGQHQADAATRPRLHALIESSVLRAAGWYQIADDRQREYRSPF